MRKITLFIVSSLLLQSLAWAGPKDSLKHVLDEYRYAVTVEWNQQDQAQLEEYKAKFSQELKKIVQEEKLSAQEFEEFIQENSRDLNLKENVLNLVKDSNGQLNLQKALYMLDQGSDDIYLQGSSWAPIEDVLLYGFLGLLVFEIVVLIITSESDECPNPDYHPNDEPYFCRY